LSPPFVIPGLTKLAPDPIRGDPDFLLLLRQEEVGRSYEIITLPLSYIKRGNWIPAGVYPELDSRSLIAVGDKFRGNDRFGAGMTE